LSLSCALTQVTLERLEQWRDGKAPLLWMEPWPTFVTSTGSSIPASMRAFPVKIPRDDWLAALSAMGYGDYIVVEIRTPPQYADRFNRAYDHLREAHKAYLEGSHNDAVAACRNAYDAIFPVLPTKEDIGVKDGDSYVGKLLEPLTDERRAAEYARIAKGLKELTHLSHHTSSAPRKFRRAEAKFVMRTTEDFLQLVAEVTADRAQ
jgi:hypothetical protein